MKQHFLAIPQFDMPISRNRQSSKTFKVNLVEKFDLFFVAFEQQNLLFINSNCFRIIQINDSGPIIDIFQIM